MLYFLLGLGVSRELSGIQSNRISRLFTLQRSLLLQESLQHQEKMMAAWNKFGFTTGKICKTLLGIFLILGCFNLGFLWKLFTTYSLPNLYEETRELEPGGDLSSSTVALQKKCACPSKQWASTVYNLREYLAAGDLESALDRRKKEFEHYKKREHTEKILITPPNSPLGFPIYGVQVMPLSTINLPGLQIIANLSEYMVSLEASLGTIDFPVKISDTSECQIQGKGEKHLTISTSNISVLNLILESITYTSTVYSIDSLDIVKFTLGEHIAQVPISIRQPPMPRLHDPGPERKIRDLVTITTKTFLRYDKLWILLKSIRQYYPDIKVIVADDNETPEKIDDPNVEQYIMPFAKGWFAGRNLAVSQVTTKYFLWVDDDFLFTSDTKIEKLVDVLEATDLDLVGGNVAGNHFSFKLILEEGGEDGDCLHWRGGGYHTIPGFPNCIVTGGVVNFFLAHTNRVLGVGFDPKLSRVAHTEFFIDGLGRLRVGSCSHVSIGHQRKENAQGKEEAEKMNKYNSFRQNTAALAKFKLGLHYFKNRLKCFTKH